MAAPVEVQSNGAAYQREWRKKHPERIGIYKRRYRNSAKGAATEKIYWSEYLEKGGFRKSSRRYRENNPDRYREIKRKYVKGCRERLNALKDAPCMDCGGRFHPAAMDFDHVRDDKNRDVAKIIDYSPEIVAAEIAKCDLVCANCHRVRTFNRLQGIN
jgi:hypothetical protein